MTTFAIQYGSLVLADTPNGIAISDINRQIEKNIQQFDLPKAHGSIIPIAKRQDVLIQIQGTCAGTSYADARSKMDALKAALEQAGEQALSLDDDRYILVQYKNFSETFVKMTRLISFSFDVVASYPFYLAAAITNDTRTPTSGVGYVINNPGNAEARVKMTFTAPGSPVADALKFQNQTNGCILQYRGTIAATKALIVNNRLDQATQTVLNDGSDDSLHMEGDFITLAPGNNTLVLTSAVGSIQVKTEFRPTYL
jgi:phage-related protein